MEQFKSYFSLIDPRLLIHINGKPGEFIRLFREENFLSEEVFIRKICGKKHGRSYYSDLKSRTIRILQALAIISTSRGRSTVTKKLENCRKFFTIGRKFLGKGDRDEGLRLIKEAYRLAVEYNFVYLACELSSILYHDHVYYNPNVRKARFYAEQVEKYLQDYIAEKKVEDYFYQILGNTNKTKQREQLQKTLVQVKNLHGTSIKYKVHEAFLIIHYGFNIGDYELVIKRCTQTLLFFDSKKGVYSSYYYSFFKNLGVAQLATGQHKEATNSFQKAEQYATAKSFNEYLSRLYKTINLLHSGDYQTAYTLYQQNKKCRYVLIRDQFAIIEAYFCFLAYTGYLQLDKVFRLGKYLNETFKAQADKQGDNINILIAELLVYLARDRGKFIDRIDAIENYSYRHLKGDDTRRARWFMRILCMMPRANFHPKALARLAKRQIENLEKYPMRMGDSFTVETIPFERILDMILIKLQREVA